MTLPVYEPGTASAYLTEKGWQVKRSGTQLVLACPYCSRKGKCYLNDETGLWDCKAASCAQKGNWYSFLRALGDTQNIKPLVAAEPKTRRSQPVEKLEPFKQALFDNPAAMAYLASRGITAETAKAWDLGYKVTGDGVHQLMIPYIKGGAVVDVKYRLLPQSDDGHRPKYQRMVGGESILFGHQLLARGKAEGRSTLFLTEGELDAITLWQAGFWPVVSTTTGAQSFKSEWFDQIKAFEPERIVICYDTDVAGQDNAKKLLQKFEQFNAVNLQLPDDVKDINEFFVTHSAEAFQELVDKAEPEEIENCKSMASVNNMLEEQLWFSTSAFDGLPSKFADINAMIAGGYWNGQLVVISGPSGTGKTSLVLEELMQFAKDGQASYLLCLEMPEIMMMRKIYQKEFEIPMLQLTQQHVKAFRPQLDKIPLFLGSRCRKLEDVDKTIRTAVARYNLKCVAFDNINYFVRSIEHSTQEIAATTKLLKDLAVELNIPIIAIAQPKKFDKDSRIMSAGDLAWAAAIEQDADTIIIVQRQRIKSEMASFGKQPAGFIGNQSPFTLVRVEKARYAGGGETFLYFDGARSTYRELTEAERQAMAAAAA